MTPSTLISMVDFMADGMEVSIIIGFILITYGSLHTTTLTTEHLITELMEDEQAPMEMHMPITRVEIEIALC